MESNKEKSARMRAIYRAAHDLGLVNKVKDFAEATGINRTSLSTALNDGSVPPQVLRLAELYAEANGIDIDNSGIIVAAPQSPSVRSGSQKNFIGADHTKEFLAELKAQRELYASQLKSQQEVINTLSALLTNQAHNNG